MISHGQYAVSKLSPLLNVQEEDITCEGDITNFITARYVHSANENDYYFVG